MSQVYFNHTTKQIPVKMGIVPAATIALKREGNDFVYGVTICSQYDSFSKKAGREIAEARLNQGFRKTAIPAELLELESQIGEKKMALSFLYQLSASVSTNHRKWKKKITKFNFANRGLAKVIPMDTVSHDQNRA
jgi:hypothetical protein